MTHRVYVEYEAQGSDYGPLWASTFDSNLGGEAVAYLDPEGSLPEEVGNPLPQLASNSMLGSKDTRISRLQVSKAFFMSNINVSTGTLSFSHRAMSLRYSITHWDVDLPGR